jgi:glutathione S-transferase
MIDFDTWSSPNGSKVQITLADIARFPWMQNHHRFGVDMADHPSVAHWLRTINERLAVRRALDLN